jgi:hypothetical protein
LEKLYALLANKGLLEAKCVYVITVGKHLIEARLLEGVLVNVKSRSLSQEQIIKSFLAGEISEVNEAPADMQNVGNDHIQAVTIIGTFPALFPIVFSSRNLSAPRAVGFLKVLKLLAGAEADVSSAFDYIAKEIQKKYHKFSLDPAVVKKRVEDFSIEFLSVETLPLIEPLPVDSRSLLGWVLDKAAMNESLFKDIFLAFAFWGEYFEPLFKTVVKKDAGFGAAVGVARVSKLFYGAASDRTTAKFFKDSRSAAAGDMKIHWHAEKNPEIRMTPVDLAKLGLADGDKVNTIFRL